MPHLHTDNTHINKQKVCFSHIFKSEQIALKVVSENLDLKKKNLNQPNQLVSPEQIQPNAIYWCATSMWKVKHNTPLIITYMYFLSKPLCIMSIHKLQKTMWSLTRRSPHIVRWVLFWGRYLFSRNLYCFFLFIWNKWKFTAIFSWVVLTTKVVFKLAFN